MQLREETMLSVRSMIQRFRENKPTSRQEREQRGKQDLWWAREESPAGKDDDARVVREHSVENNRLRSPITGEKIRRSGVDNLMSRDIQSFITTTTANRTDRSRKPPHVMPSSGLAPASHMPAHSSVGYYPRSSLVLAADHKRAGFGRSGGRCGEDNTHELYLQDSHEPEPRIYSGGAELRDRISLTSPKPAADDESGQDKQQLDLIRGEHATWENIPSAVGVASDLDGVLKQLRGGIVQRQQAGSSGHLSPRESLPVNLVQIAHDLDAKLLEFTLMAKAREQVANEAFTAEEAEKDAWRQSETKRVEDMVREEHAMLQDAANRRDGTVSPMETIGVEDADHMFEGFIGRINPRRHILDGDRQARRTLPTRHPALPPSALGPRKFHFLENADVSMEAVTHQIAGVLRAVEAKAKKIEALEVDGSSGQQNGGPGNPSGAQIAPLVSPPGMPDSLSSSANENDKEGGGDADNTNDINFDRKGKPLDLTADRGHLAVTSDGTLLAEGAYTEIGPTPRYAPGTTYNDFSRHFLASSEAAELPNVSVQPWCTSQTTLQETGQCIGAELEVVMLCMQKRLGKQPIVYGEQDATDELETKRGADNSVFSKPAEQPPEKEVRDSSEISPQRVLQALADGMELHQEQDTHTELDRELGLDFNDPGDDWCGRGSAAARPGYSRRVPHDAAHSHVNFEVGAAVEGIDHEGSSHWYPPRLSTWTSPWFETPPKNAAGLATDKEIIVSSPFDTATYFPPDVAPIDGPTTRRVPLASMLHPAPQSQACQSSLPNPGAEEAFMEDAARTRDLRVLDNTIGQRPLAGFSHRKDMDGGGCAVSRARRRLGSFRTARQQMSTGTNTNMTHSRHESTARPTQLSVDYQAMPHFQDAKATLSRLKDMRNTLTRHSSRDRSSDT